MLLIRHKYGLSKWIQSIRAYTMIVFYFIVKHEKLDKYRRDQNIHSTFEMSTAKESVRGLMYAYFLIQLSTQAHARIK